MWAAEILFCLSPLCVECMWRYAFNHNFRGRICRWKNSHLGWQPDGNFTHEWSIWSGFEWSPVQTLVCLYRLCAFFFELYNVLIIHREMHLWFAIECSRERHKSQALITLWDWQRMEIYSFEIPEISNCCSHIDKIQLSYKRSCRGKPLQVTRKRPQRSVDTDKTLR